MNRDPQSTFERLLDRAQRLAGDGKVAEARALLRMAVTDLPAEAGPVRTFLAACERAAAWAEAEAALRQLARLRPDENLDAPLAAVLFNQHRYEEALECFGRLRQRDPAAIPPIIDSVRCLQMLERMEEAVDLLHESIARLPGHQSLHQALGYLLMQLREADAAEAVINHMLAVFPHDQALLSLAGKHLLRKYDYARGFDYFRNRWVRNPAAQPGLALDCPAWDGQPFDGTLLVAAEGGIRQELLASSMFGDLAARGQRCLIECSAALLALFRRSFPALVFVERGRGELARRCAAANGFSSTQAPGGILVDFGNPAETLRKVDAGDLGFFLRREPGSFPPPGAWLQPDPQRTAERRALYLLQSGPQPLVGLSWLPPPAVPGGRPQGHIALRGMAPLLQCQGVTLVSVQEGDARSEIERVRAELSVPLLLDPSLDGAADLDLRAAQLAALDLVITADHQTAMLAGALGKTCWLLLRHRDSLPWWWGYAGRHTPFFPTVEIFRVDPFSATEEALTRLIGHVRGRLEAILPESGAGRVPEVVRRASELLYTERQPHLAAQAIREALPLLRDDPDALLACSRLSDAMQDWATAEEIYRRVGELRPRSGFEASLGAALYNQRRFQEAIRWFRRHTENHPRDVEAWMGIALSLCRLGRHEEAADLLETRAVELHNERVHYVLAMILVELGVRERAEAGIRAALEQFPDSALVQGVAGYHYLRCGDYARGFALHRSRWSGHYQPQGTAVLPCPAWDGRRVEGTLLVAAEEAIGEEILFSSMLGDLVAMGQAAVVECEARLLPLFRRSFPQLEFVLRDQGLLAERLRRGGNFRKVDAGDLGGFLRTDRTRFPLRERWLLPEADKAAALRERYRALFGDRLLVGVGWKSSRKILDQGFDKNIDITALAPLLSRPDTVFVSLQHGEVDADLARLRAETGLSVWVDPEVNTTIDLDMLAAQVAALDGVVSTSNSAVHFAGALGVPCDVLLRRKQPLMWYWGYEEEGTPWYPSLRLLRSTDLPGEHAGMGRNILRARERLDAIARQKTHGH